MRSFTEIPKEAQPPSLLPVAGLVGIACGGGQRDPAEFNHVYALNPELKSS